MGISWMQVPCVHQDPPPPIRANKEGAFFDCAGMTAAILNVELDVIWEWVFRGCRSLVRINIPPAVRAIKEGAFFDCLGMTAVVLNNELEDIGARAFCRCRSLVPIKILNAIRVVHETASMSA